MAPILVIGYGNTLRSDDGAGPKVAEAFSAQENVRAIATHQLTPELAEDLIQAKQVYFVDAAPVKQVTLQRIHLQDYPETFSHFVTPQGLLNLIKHLYQRPLPEAYFLLIPAENFTIGETFSDLTQAGVLKAIAFLQARIKLCG
jgi:hydrogenase maturation protease